MKILLTVWAIGLFVTSTLAQDIFPLKSVHSSTKESVDVMVTDIDGKTYPLSTVMTSDKNYVVSIMASWCGPCRSELDLFQTIAEKWRKELNTEIIALSVEKPSDTHKLFNLVKKQNWTIPVFHEKMAYTSRELEVFNIPQTFLVNQKGEIVYKTSGYKSNLIEKYEKQIKKLKS